MPAAAGVEGWRQWAGTISALVLGLLFVVAGIWKLSDPISTEARMVQALIPKSLALAVALAAGVVETWAGVLLLVPRWRRWGAWLSGLMLVAFLLYFAVFYGQLKGADCSCFPWLKRVVGPEFFIGDGLMLGLAVAAGVWSSKGESWKQALMALGAIAVSAGVLYGVSLTRQTGVKAPARITVDSKPLSLEEGRVLLYFFDPECMHCFAGAKALAAQRWKDVKVVAVPTVNPHWAIAFLRDTGLRAGVSFDVKLLREAFQFTDPPYAVAVENGRQAQAFAFFDDKEPVAGLKALGWVE